MSYTRSRLLRRPAALVAALAAMLVLATVPATAAPAPTGFRTGSTVLVLQNLTSAAVIQATPPQSFCYVGVAWPASIDADWKATATWTLDCRSRANPSLPAPDISSILMDVRIYQGEYTPWDRGREVGHDSCSGSATTRPCSTKTVESLIFGAPYYTILHVQVALTGGTNQVGEFYTDPIRRT